VNFNGAAAKAAPLFVPGDNVMTIQTPEEVAHDQAMIERFAHMASNVMITVEALEDAALDLVDFPESIGQTLPQLRAAAELIARAAWDWAKLSNASFDPRKPW
jgi:hypothetical protein